MKKSIIITSFAWVLSVLLLSPGFSSSKPIVFVSVVPQKFFVQQICNDLVDVQVMVKPGASPVTYEPKPSQMAKLAKSSVYLAVGAPFEKVWLDKFRGVSPSMKIVHTDKDIHKLAMIEHLHEQGDHGGKAEAEATGHEDKILDPHIWLSPGLVKKQAAAILAAMKDILPADGATLDLNYHAFLKKIDQLDRELKDLLKGTEGMQFMVFHPSWGYFAREYGLQQIPIEMEGKEPKPAQLRELINHARENDIKVIFAQRQFSMKNAKIVAREIKGEVLPVDPLAEDWFGNLRDVAENIKRAAR